jgi:ribosomal protein L7/L12
MVNIDFLSYEEQVAFEKSLWERSLSASSTEETERFLTWLEVLRTPKGSTLKITGFDDGCLIPVIKCFRTLSPGMGLAEAKFRVERRVLNGTEDYTSGILWEDLSQKEAASKAQALRQAGAQIVIIQPLAIEDMDTVQGYDS